MSTTTNDQGRKTLPALEAIPYARRVAISTSAAGVIGVVVATETARDIGVSTNAATAAGELVVVALPQALGTVEVALTGNPVTAGGATGLLYTAATGYVNSAAISNGSFWGIAHGNGVTGDIIEAQRASFVAIP
jgi:hypothetical protein